ncbi:MAG: nitroreductase family protein [Chloroflexi bacterium]|nr:nitroreductase family protein [Chloroflexota bacterium]MBI3734551.1 nitroreductase family protein [Chloroflexota bacterium]
MNVSEAIRAKRSIRQFTDQPVPTAAVRAILDAGRRAQSSKNTQPWAFVVVRDRAALQALADCGPFAKHLAGAAVAVALLSPDPAERWSIPFDVGQAAAYMQLAAWELGIGSCLAAIYEMDKARAILGIPAGKGEATREWPARSRGDSRAPLRPYFYAALSFGYPAPGTAHAPRRGGRRALAEIVRWDKW